MNTASASLVHELRPKIIERRERLQAVAHHAPAQYVNDLLDEIDATLRKIDNGTYGLCETCHDPIEADRLANDPMVRFCLDHLTSEERRAHEEDMRLATRIQATLLPSRDIQCAGWEMHYRYEPAGLVGGDYCEVIKSGEGASFFAVGDVSGKGVAASLLMTHLSAIFRSLLTLDLELAQVILRANRLFCESTPASHYATIAAGRTTDDGVELCNAGHCRPLLVRSSGTDCIDATGVPLGLFCNAQYAVTRIPMDPGDSLVLYTDGITEARDREGSLYDEPRLVRLLQDCLDRNPLSMAETVLKDVARFADARPREDDMTLLIVRRSLNTGHRQ